MLCNNNTEDHLSLMSHLLPLEVLNTLFKLLIFCLISLPQLLQHLEEEERGNRVLAHGTLELTFMLYSVMQYNVLLS